jgi:hypothetical protein
VYDGLGRPSYTISADNLELVMESMRTLIGDAHLIVTEEQNSVSKPYDLGLSQYLVRPTPCIAVAAMVRCKQGTDITIKARWGYDQLISLANTRNRRALGLLERRRRAVFGIRASHANDRETFACFGST